MRTMVVIISIGIIKLVVFLESSLCARHSAQHSQAQGSHIPVTLLSDEDFGLRYVKGFTSGHLASIFVPLCCCHSRRCDSGNERLQ